MFVFRDDHKYGYEVVFQCAVQSASKQAALLANMVLMLVAPKGGAGKTTLTLGSAQALAARGARVLVIDAAEGQAQLSMRFAPDTMGDRDHAHYDLGFGHAVYALAGHLSGLQHLPDKDLGKELLPIAQRVVRQLRPVMKQIQVDPNTGATMDFLPCASSRLAAAAGIPLMGIASKRQALFQAVLTALAMEFDGGWDFIFFDVLPSTTSSIVQGALGVASRVGIVVDCWSSGPLAGLRELYQVTSQIAPVHGREEHLVAGWVMNRMPDPDGRVPLVCRIDNLEIQALVQETGIPVLARVKNLDSLAMMGHNQYAVEELQRAFGGRISAHSEELTKEQLLAVQRFQTNAGVELSMGIRMLAKRNPGVTAAALMREERELMPMILHLAGDPEAAIEWLDRQEAEESAVGA